ncbi:MAG: branched chain amino acid aminotransferase, partial [Lacticaseibacillus paracasei]
ITPIASITYEEHEHVFYSETKVGPYTQKLYDELTGIQFGDVPAPEGWVVDVPFN